MPKRRSERENDEKNGRPSQRRKSARNNDLAKCPASASGKPCPERPNQRKHHQPDRVFVYRVRTACDAANEMAGPFLMVRPRTEGTRLKSQTSKGYRSNYRRSQRHEAGDPQTACACIHGVLLCPCNVDFLPKPLPVVNLLQGSADCLIVRSAFSARAFVDFFQVPGKFGNNLLPFAFLQRQLRESIADEFLPIRHGAPSPVAAALQIVQTIPRAAAQPSSCRST